MTNHSPSSDRPAISTAAGVALIVLTLIISGCTRSSTSESTVEPVASTIDTNEPVVVVQDGAQADTDAQLTVSEAVPGDADQVATDQYVIADDVVTLPPDRIEELLDPESTTTSSSSSTAESDSARTTISSAIAVPTTTAGAPNTTGAPTEATGSVSTVPDSSTTPGSPVTTTPTGPTSTVPTSTVPTSSQPTASVPPNTIPGPTDAIELDPLGPIPGASSANNDTPLAIVQYSPEGPVQTAPYVTVTFNQPMKITEGKRPVAVPITIQPKTVGSWRWLGDRTVRFEPADMPDGRIRRFAAATLYRVTVSGGIQAASGQRLGVDTAWQFATPPPTVLTVQGASAEREDAPEVETAAVFVVQSDQRIDAADVVAATTLTANGEPVPIRAATEAEIEDHPTAADAVGAVGDDRAAVIAPIAPLPPSADLLLTIGPNLSSGEGELAQPDAVSYYARTRGTPRIESSACAPTDCAAGATLEITLNNPLDVADQSRADLASLITVTPPVPGLEIQVLGSQIRLVGDTVAGTDYTVTLRAGLSDVFGQKLPDDARQTFKIGDAHPFFDGPRSEMVILDPEAQSPTLAVQSVNHERIGVTVWAVTTAEFQQYLQLRALDTADTSRVPETWQRLSEDSIDIDAKANELVTTEIDLDDELSQAGSQLVVLVSPDPAVQRSDPFAAQNQPLWTWVQRTSLGVDAIADESTLMIWTTDLRTGKPVTGIPVSLIGDSRVATTDEEGIQVIKLTDEPIQGLIADDGTTVTYLPAPDRDGWKISASTQRSRWEVVLDGTTHRPGEQVRMTGWVRGLDPRADRLLTTPEDETEVQFTVIDSDDREVAAGSTVTNRRGGFSATFELPADVGIGRARILLRSGTSSAIESFDVSQFRTPEFEVELQTSADGPLVAGSPLEIGAIATYGNGSPVSNATAHWSIETEPAVYRPPNWQGFQFGLDRSTPNTSGYGSPTTRPTYCADCPSPQAPKEIVGTTDGTGSHGVQIDVDDPQDLPVTVSAVATIDDAEQNRSSASSRILVHPAELYVGLRTPTLFTELGEPIVVDAVVTDINGAEQDDRQVTITLNRVVSTWRNGEWVRSPEPVDGCIVEPSGPPTTENDQAGSVRSAAPAAMTCDFEADTGGEYLIEASVVDRSGNRSRTELTRWVSGALALPSTTQQLEQATVVPDRDHYAPGDTARLLIGAPWAPARGVVVLSRYNIEETIPFETEDGSVIVEVPITDRSVPNVTGWVTMLGAAPRLDKNGNVIPGETRPAVASGRIDISVPATDERLDVTVRPETAIVRPGEDTALTVEVRDVDGEPVPDAQVAVIVADDSDLATVDYDSADPAAVFYAGYPGELLGISSRQYVQLLDTQGVDPNPEAAAIDAEAAATSPPDDTGSAVEPATSTLSAAPTGSPAEYRNRSTPLALYSTDNFTDDSGSIVVDFRAPESSSRLRVAAVAVGPEQRFGSGEAVVTAGQPLDVRVDPPDFVRVGDDLSLPVVLTNHTDEPLTVATAIEVAGLVLADGAGQQVTVDGESTLELRYKMRGAETGQASIRLVAEASSTGRDGDDYRLRTESSLAFAVRAPATAQRYVSAGILPAGEIQQVATQRIFTPSAFQKGFGGLQVSVSTSVMSTVADVAEGLSEPAPTTANTERAARIIAAEAIRDRAELVAKEVDVDALTRQGRQTFQRLLRSKKDDGSWSDWPRRKESDAWVTVIAAEAVLSGLDAKWGSISDEDRATMLAYLADIETHIPDDFPTKSRNLVRAYAVRVLRRAGGRHAAQASARAAELLNEAGADIQPDAAALIWSSLTTPDQRSRVEQILADRATPTDTGIIFANDYSAADYVVDWSQPRVDAVVLTSLIEMSPNSDLIEPSLTALLAERTIGTWGNAQANAMASRAVRAFGDRFESPTPNRPEATRVEAWAGSTKILDQYIASGQVIETGTRLANIAGANSRIVIARTGSERLYVRSRLSFAPSASGGLRDSLSATDNGFVVERSYEPILDASDVARMSNGSWKIRRGSPVRVRLVMVTDSVRTNVALIDELPAGLTPVSPSLAVAQANRGDTTAASMIANDYARWPGWNWFDHQQLGEHSTETVTESLAPGSYEYIYVARATAPGRFLAPPAVADAIYDPAVSGSTRVDEIIVE